MEATQAVLLFAAAALAGAINSVAGGGTLVSFPAALVFSGLPGRIASATSSVALAPAALAAAWAFRRELRGKGKLVGVLAGPALLGGLLGAWLLRVVEESVFEALVPWLVLGASLLIVGKDALIKKALEAKKRMSRRRMLFLAACVLLVSVYSGYFGAGKNLMVLALLMVLARSDIIEANAIKSAVVSIFMVVIATYFLVNNVADLPTAGVMAAGATVGSFGGASLARRVKPLLVRITVVTIGVTLSVVLAYQKLAA